MKCHRVVPLSLGIWNFIKMKFYGNSRERKRKKQLPQRDEISQREEIPQRETMPQRERLIALSIEILQILVFGVLLK